MIFKRIYNKEIKFLIICFTVTAIAAGGVLFSAFHKNTNKFETLLQGNNYKALYSYIDNPDFSEKIFIKYMKYNFGDKVSIKSKSKNGDSTDYVLKGINRDVTVSLLKKDDKFVWAFDDYLYNWHIKLPKSASLYIEGERIVNNDGEVVINRLPFSIYNVRAYFTNIETYNENILAGQKLEMKFKLPVEVLNRCNEIVKKYLQLEEAAVNNKSIDNLDKDFLDPDSGILKEIADEIDWLKGQDYRSIKKLISEEIINSEINDEDVICVDVLEKWDVTVSYEKNTSHEVQDVQRKYFIKSGQKYIITQIKTNIN